MVKNVLSVIAGVIAGFILILVFETIGHLIAPLPEGIDISDIESIKENLDKIPVLNMVLVLVAYAIGAFGAGFVTIKIAKTQKINMALITGLILMLFGIFNLITIPHPVWFTIVNLFLFLPMAWAGGKSGLL
jgi:hypothetical membrane protein